MQALNESAFVFGTAEELWRASCAWAGNGHGEQAEWLLEMAAELVDIRELPETAEPVVRMESGLPVGLDVRAALLREHDRKDIPF